MAVRPDSCGPWRRRARARRRRGPPVTPWMRPSTRLCRLSAASPSAIKPRDETVGSRRRPGLLDAKLLDAADLRRLAIVEPTVEGRADPEIGRHRLHHRFAELALAQHEFGQLRAQAEEGHPVVARRATHDAGGIASVVLDDDPLPFAATRKRRSADAPRTRATHRSRRRRARRRRRKARRACRLAPARRSAADRRR